VESILESVAPNQPSPVRVRISVVKNRKNITARVSRNPAETEKNEREFLEKLTHAERIELTWQLSEEQWKAKDADESRFSRHRTRVIRR
jgi:hypothetical protein